MIGGNQTTEQLTLIAFDGVVYSTKDHYRLESDYVGSYNLIIDRVNEDDQGEYQCQINTEPRKTKRIFLIVQGNLLFNTEKIELYLREKKEVETSAFSIHTP
jgi:hypothetical protein